MIVSITIILFVIANPIVSVLGFLVAFDLLAKATNGNSNPINTAKLNQINSNIVSMQNNSLEHDIVEKMAPIPYSITPITNDVYPTLGFQHDASAI